MRGRLPWVPAIQVPITPLLPVICRVRKKAVLCIPVIDLRQKEHVPSPPSGSKVCRDSCFQKDEFCAGPSWWVSYMGGGGLLDYGCQTPLHIELSKVL